MASGELRTAIFSPKQFCHILFNLFFEQLENRSERMSVCVCNVGLPCRPVLLFNNESIFITFTRQIIMNFMRNTTPPISREINFLFCKKQKRESSKHSYKRQYKTQLSLSLSHSPHSTSFIITSLYILEIT